MTLILTLSSPSGIYQSSDYRLTSFRGNAAKSEDDIAGSKQLTIASDRLIAQLCFTGIAQVGTNKTRDWIGEIIEAAKQPIDIDLLASEIASRGARVAKLAAREHRMLTVVIAITKTGQKPRLIMVSNVNRFGAPRRQQPHDDLELSFATPSRSTLTVLGWDAGFDPNDRRYLESLSRSSSDHKAIMDALSAVNARTARNLASDGKISEGCMVSALLPDGRNFSINYGDVKGIPDSFINNLNMGELLRENLGPGATIRQTAGLSGVNSKGAPELVPEGEFRTFSFSTPTTTMNGISNTSGGVFDKLTIEGLSGSVSIRKNEPASAVLANIRFEAGPTGPAPQHERELPLFARFAVPNLPALDGANPRTWDYGFDLMVNGKLHTIKLRQLSVALRSVNCKQPLPLLGDHEELYMAAPKNGLILSAQEGEIVSGTIDAQFILRDFPELGPAVTSHSVSVSFPTKKSPNKSAKVGRNDKCPCGSGQKYKRCHGR